MCFLSSLTFFRLVDVLLCGYMECFLMIVLLSSFKEVLWFLE